MEGHYKIVKLLLEFGADINKAHNDGTTPVCVASGNAYYKTIRLLLEAGADANLANNQGYSPLYWSSKKNIME